MSSEWDSPMKRNNATLVFLWILAGASLLLGLLLTAQSVGELARTTELWARKAQDHRELTRLAATEARYQAILGEFSHYPAGPVRIEELARDLLPGRSLTVRSTESRPAVPGWTLHKVNVDLTDLSGSELGRWLEAAAAAKPPWAVVECTLTAAPVQGRLAKAGLVMEAVERDATGH